MKNEAEEGGDHLEEHGDSGILSADAKVPSWLKIAYLTLPIWGIFWCVVNWNGVVSWLDNGQWDQLEKASNTTFPSVNYIEMKEGPAE